MQIRIHLLKKCGSGSCFFCCTTHERLLKSKKQWSFCKFTLKNWINLQLFTISMHFLFLIEKFLLDPDPGGKTNGTAALEHEFLLYYRSWSRKQELEAGSSFFLCRSRLVKNGPTLQHCHGSRGGRGGAQVLNYPPCQSCTRLWLVK